MVNILYHSGLSFVVSNVVSSRPHQQQFTDIDFAIKPSPDARIGSLAQGCPTKLRPETAHRFTLPMSISFASDESTVESTAVPVEKMRDYVEVPPATSPVDAPMDIAPPEVVPETKKKKKSATIEKVKKKKVIKANRKEEVESVVPIQRPVSPRCFVSGTSEKDDAGTNQEATKPLFAFTRSNALTQGIMSLHLAARLGRLEQAEMLLKLNPSKEYIEKPDHDEDISFRCTALQVAAYFGQVTMMELLLDEKADINSIGESEQLHSPLFLASMRGHTEAVELLVRRGVDHRREDCFGQLPLELAMGGPGKILATQTNPDKRIKVSDLIMLLKKEGQNATDTITNLMIPAKTVNKSGSQSFLWKPVFRLSERLEVVTCPRFNGKRHGHFPKEALVLDRDLDLPTLEQNLLRAGEVKVVLRVLPYFFASTACDRQILTALAITGNEATLVTDTVQAMVSSAWSKMRIRTAAEIMLNAVNVGLLCYVSYGFTKQDHGAVQALYVLTFIHIKMALEELIQQLEAMFGSIQTACRSWLRRDRVPNMAPFLDIDQVTDMGYQILGCWALLKQWNHMYDELDEEGKLKLHLEKRWMAAFSAMAWFRFCYSLRGETWFGPRILPMAFALRDTVVFFLFALICVCAATHAYYNLQLREDSEHTSSLYQSLLQVLRLGIFGDFDLFDFEGADPYLDLTTHDDVGPSRQVFVEEDPRPGKRYEDAHILFYGVGLGITILLMNLLIGVLGSNFELYQDRAPGLFNQYRAKLLLEIDCRPIIRVVRYLDRVALQLKLERRWYLAMLLSSVSTCLAILQNFFHFALLLCALPLLVILAPFCSWSGAYYTFRRVLKAHRNQDAEFNQDGTNRPLSERHYIWVVQKEDFSGAELRSLHALVKEKVNDLGDTLQSKLSEMEDRLMERLSNR